MNINDYMNLLLIEFWINNRIICPQIVNMHTLGISTRMKEGLFVYYLGFLSFFNLIIQGRRNDFGIGGRAKKIF